MGFYHSEYNIPVLHTNTSLYTLHCKISTEMLMQFVKRFGSGSVPTHIIGAALFRGEWKAAVNMILDPREGDILLLVACLIYKD